MGCVLKNSCVFPEYVLSVSLLLPIVYENLTVNVRLVLVQIWGILGLGRNKKEEDSLHVLWVTSQYFLEKKNITFCVIGFFSTFGYHSLLFRSLRSWLEDVALCQEHKLGGVKGLHG